MQPELKNISRQAYYFLEETAEVKHEYYQGEIFAMTGGTFNHAAIGVNIITALKARLRGKPCQPTNSDMRIETPDGFITYPDAAVFCGGPQLTVKPMWPTESNGYYWSFITVY